MQETTSLPEAPAVSATSAASTNTWLSGANSLFRLPAAPLFPIAAAPPAESPPVAVVNSAPCPLELPPPFRALAPACISHSAPDEADARHAPIFPKKRRLFFRHSCLKKTHCSPTQHPLCRRIPARRRRKFCSLPQNASGLPPLRRAPAPACVFRRAAPHTTESAESLPRLSCSGSLAEKKASSADAAVPLPPRSVRRGQAASPGKRGSLIPPCRKSRKKKTARAKTQTV